MSAAFFSHSQAGISILYAVNVRFILWIGWLTISWKRRHNIVIDANRFRFHAIASLHWTISFSQTDNSLNQSVHNNTDERRKKHSHKQFICLLSLAYFSSIATSYSHYTILLKIKCLWKLLEMTAIKIDTNRRENGQGQTQLGQKKNKYDNLLVCGKSIIILL